MQNLTYRDKEGPRRLHFNQLPGDAEGAGLWTAFSNKDGSHGLSIPGGGL